MSLIADWIARLRGKSPQASRVSVLAFDQYEELTATQAIRFEELQQALKDQGIEISAGEPEQPWYSLRDASRRTQVSREDLLAAAGAGRLHCFVYARNAAGYWDAAASTPVPSSVPDFLEIPAAQCRQIIEFGSASIKNLEYHHSPKNVLRYRLQDAAWVDLETLYLQHPLPEPDALTE